MCSALALVQLSRRGQHNRAALVLLNLVLAEDAQVSTETSGSGIRSSTCPLEAALNVVDSLVQRSQ